MNYLWNDARVTLMKVVQEMHTFNGYLQVPTYTHMFKGFWRVNLWWYYEPLQETTRVCLVLTLHLNPFIHFYFPKVSDLSVRYYVLNLNKTLCTQFNFHPDLVEYRWIWL